MMLPKKLRDRLVDALMGVPGTDNRSGRTALLDGIPPNVRSSLNRDDSQFVDLTNIINQLEGLGRLANGERPTIIIAQNAYRIIRGTDLGRELEEIQKSLEEAYGGEPPSADIPSIPEALVFGGTGEWVSETFLDRARLAGTRVARLLIPRFEGGQLRAAVGGLGTGWLLTPDLLLTNYHVVAARHLRGTKNRPPEPAPSETDFTLQGQSTVAWFDYHVEGKQPPDVRVTGVICKDRELDYVLLRLQKGPELTGRKYMAVTRGKPEFVRASRLNIVQCPRGGPLRYAIRNNFYIGGGEKPFQMRYLTDTEVGSSGSPVLDDSWQVVALHYGAIPVNPALYEGDAGFHGVAKYHNQGVAIDAILSDLPPAVFDEVKAAQEWT